MRANGKGSAEQQYHMVGREATNAGRRMRTNGNEHKPGGMVDRRRQAPGRGGASEVVTTNDVLL